MCHLFSQIINSKPSLMVSVLLAETLRCTEYVISEVGYKHHIFGVDVYCTKSVIQTTHMRSNKTNTVLCFYSRPPRIFTHYMMQEVFYEVDVLLRLHKVEDHRTKMTERITVRSSFSLIE